MTRSLATRLTDLLDVIQVVGCCRRSAATRRIALACGVSPTYAADLATRAVRVKRPTKFNAAALLELEGEYRHELTALRTYKRACANVRVAA